MKTSLQRQFSRMNPRLKLRLAAIGLAVLMLVCLLTWTVFPVDGGTASFAGIPVRILLYSLFFPVMLAGVLFVHSNWAKSVERYLPETENE